MDNRSFQSGASASAPSAPASPSVGYPTNGNPGTGTPATLPGEYWFHQIGEELRNVIVDAGLTPDDADLTQLSTAVQTLSGNSASGYKNLVISTTGTNASVTVGADELTLKTPAGTYRRYDSVSFTINSGASGLDGLDTGSLAGSTWYAVWAVGNGSVAHGVISLSTTAPTMPSGYIDKFLCGYIKTDASGNKYPLGLLQVDDYAQYKIAAGSNTLSMPLIASGAQGTYATSSPTYASAAVRGASVPASAIAVKLALFTRYLNNAVSDLAVAPNNAYGGTYDTNPPPVNLYGSASPPIHTIYQSEMMLESNNIYVASNQAGAAVACFGWRNNL